MISLIQRSIDQKFIHPKQQGSSSTTSTSTSSSSSRDHSTRKSSKAKTCQPRFNFLNSVALDFNGPAGANPNGVVAGILWNGDLECRSEFVEENVLVSRHFFDPCRDSGTVLSVCVCVWNAEQAIYTHKTNKQKTQAKTQFIGFRK